ncbi:MAG: hypothetical protein JRD49_09790 [Deltaproteobacteria bacterium]|nr:hypothetical protein [Deltaproteobacteria bacterium]MBW2677849.1 hypothetical protein [Deltaproteobacteria bacterium]
MESPPNRCHAPKATRRNFIKALFAARKRARQDTPLNKRFCCCANCRHYVPPNDPMMLDGPLASYCKHPERVGSRYICDATFIAAAGLYRKPGDKLNKECCLV